MSPRRALRAGVAALGLAVLLTELLTGGVAAGGPAPDRSAAVRTGAATTGAVTTGAVSTGAATVDAAAKVSFRIGTFNILSSWHTRVGRGEAHMAPGPMRAHLAAEAIRAYAAPVVGFQEIDMDQIGVLDAEMPDYNFYPGSSLGASGVMNNIAWDTRRFQRIAGGYLRLEFLGQMRAVPWIRLKDRPTGRQFWVMNVHNSPNRGGSQTYEAERRRQLAAEIAKLQELHKTGYPVFLTGDLNDKQYTYCQIVTKTALRAPQGGNGSCTLPPNSHIEWIFGARADWSNFKYDRGPLVRRVTDHPVMFATATLR